MLYQLQDLTSTRLNSVLRTINSILPITAVLHRVQCPFYGTLAMVRQQQHRMLLTTTLSRVITWLSCLLLQTGAVLTVLFILLR